MTETTDGSNLIPLARIRYCNFCGASQDQREYLIVSPSGDADICEKCVDVCVEAIQDARTKKAETP